MKDYKEIRQRFLAGESQRSIAKSMNISRNTVKKYCEGAKVPWERKTPERQSTILAYSDENGHLIHFYPCTGTGAIWTGNPFSSGHPFRTFVDTGSV